MERKKTLFARMVVFLAFILMTNIAYAQDKVELKDGSTISCNIKEITEKNVIFQQEGVKDDTTMPISEILTITYANGEKDVFGKVEEEVVEENDTKNNVSTSYKEPGLTPSDSGMLSNINKDNDDFRKWNIMYRLGPAFIKTPKEEGVYRWSTAFELTAGGKYNFSENLGLNFGLGWWSTNNISSTYASRYGASKTEGHSDNIIIPIELSLYQPLSKNIGLIVEAGPSITYGISGYIKIDGEKYTWKKLEDEHNESIDRFGCFLKVGGGINLWDIRIQGYFGIPLTKDNYGSKQKNFWGITAGCAL